AERSCPNARTEMPKPASDAACKKRRRPRRRSIRCSLSEEGSGCEDQEARRLLERGGPREATVCRTREPMIRWQTVHHRRLRRCGFLVTRRRAASFRVHVHAVANGSVGGALQRASRWHAPANPSLGFGCLKQIGLGPAVAGQNTLDPDNDSTTRVA